MADAGADLDRVALDLHAAAAPVAELAPGHVAVQRLAVQLEAGGQALDDRDQPRAVRLARCREAKFHAPRLDEASGATAAAVAPRHIVAAMAARRLLIIMLVLLGISTLAAALVGNRPLREEGTGSTIASETEPTVPPDTVPEGRQLKPVVIEVGRARSKVIPMKVGDQLALIVRSPQAGLLEIPALGLLEPVAPERARPLRPVRRRGRAATASGW